MFGILCNFSVVSFYFTFDIYYSDASQSVCVLVQSQSNNITVLLVNLLMFSSKQEHQNLVVKQHTLVVMHINMLVFTEKPQKHKIP